MLEGVVDDLADVAAVVHAVQEPIQVQLTKPNVPHLIVQQDDFNDMQMNSDEGEDCGDFYSLADAGSLDDSFIEENESVDEFDDIFHVAQELTVEEQNAAFQRDLAIWVLNCNVGC